MKIAVRAAFQSDIGRIKQIYEDLCDYLEEHCYSIRLDVVKRNTPAENLYTKCGFQFIDTVSLGYEAYGLPWYNLYEKVIFDPSIVTKEPSLRTKNCH